MDYVRVYQDVQLSRAREAVAGIGLVGMSERVARTALVTGASRGLGAAMAVALAEAGHRVAVNYY